MEKFEHLEYLSKLKFSDEEKVSFEKDFDSIVTFVDEIKKLELPDDLEKDISHNGYYLGEYISNNQTNFLDYLSKANAPKI